MFTFLGEATNVVLVKDFYIVNLKMSNCFAHVCPCPRAHALRNQRPGILFLNYSYENKGEENKEVTCQRLY